jgi:hypothetical protein
VRSAANNGDPSGPREPGASNPEPVSPQLARARRATRRMWDSLESEYGLLTGEEVAELLGAGPNNRNYAASKRSARKVIGVRRGTVYRYPAFQFDRKHGVILEFIEPLIGLADANKWSLEDLWP